MITKNQECDIINDLLPLYLEHKTSGETDIFIQEHMKQCETCRKNLEFMDTSYEELFLKEMRGRNPYKKSRIFGKAKGRLFLYGYLFFLFCWWMYIIACYL